VAELLMPLPKSQGETRKKFAIAVLLALSFKMTGTHSTAGEEDPQKRFEHAVKIYKSGNWKKAEKECRELLKATPTFAEAHELLGFALEHDGDYNRAMAEYRLAIKLNPKVAVYHVVLGSALDKENNLQGALGEYRIANELDPKDQETGLKIEGITQELDAVAEIERHKTSWAGKVTEPFPIYKRDPPYTPEARQAKTQGTVVLSVIIGKDGSVLSARLLKGLDPGLDVKAIETVRTWKFKPATANGQPVPVKVMVQVTFRLF
jgi:TonB family protein